MKAKEIPGEGHWRAAFREEPGTSGCGASDAITGALRKAEATAHTDSRFKRFSPAVAQ
ncbi:MAG TPA: hypothetical protein VF131_05970 [Blastocatellia bacterium]|nr:hypothetical protein [Blastocatellia bacterium]